MTTNVKIGCLALSGLVVSLALVFFVAVAFGLMRLPLMNIEREVTTHSQQYIQTQQTVLLNYYADWQRGDEPHKAAAKTEICATAALLDETEWPAQVAPFITLNCH